MVLTSYAGFPRKLPGGSAGGFQDRVQGAEALPFMDAWNHNVGPTAQVTATRNPKGKATLTFSKGLRSFISARMLSWRLGARQRVSVNLLVSPALFIGFVVNVGRAVRRDGKRTIFLIISGLLRFSD